MATETGSTSPTAGQTRELAPARAARSRPESAVLPSVGGTSGRELQTNQSRFDEQSLPMSGDAVQSRLRSTEQRPCRFMTVVDASYPGGNCGGSLRLATIDAVPRELVIDRRRSSSRT
jgi:hypothetical protein